MNADVMFSSKTDQWATPLEFFQEIDKEFDFDLDPCADEQNHKCVNYFTKEQNGLLQDWGGIGCFATLHTAQISRTGLKRVMKKAINRIQSLFYSFLQEQTQSIFMIIFISDQRLDLSKDALSLEIARTQHHFRQCLLFSGDQKCK